MRLLYYIQTKPLDKDSTLYGYSCILNGEAFETVCGVSKEGNEAKLVENITKNIMEKNSKNTLRTTILFKYESLDLAKHMLFNFEHSKEYDDLMNRTKVEAGASPAIFLSDSQYKLDLKKSMENYMEQYKYFSKKPLDKSFSR
jgi:hypothetical protein